MEEQNDDPVWDHAWSWVRREHDRGSFDGTARAQLRQWLLADAAHRKAYDKAARLWLIVGLVPPSDGLAHPDE